MHIDRDLPAGLDRVRDADARAVRYGAGFVGRVTPGDLGRPTPCTRWSLAELLAHMTAQHRGFAAAAAGRGDRAEAWRALPAGADVVAEYAAACDLVAEAFAAVGSAERPFALPEFGPGATFPAGRAIGFHFIDYVVHGWDVARSLGLPYAPPPELLDAALPIALAVPDGEHRLAPGSAFRPALAPLGAVRPLDRILTALGRSPQWPG
ncbi:TIGR03086 family metal-binding protein [Streptomyces sp. NBC_00442]|uniref:TIGR03086 family metal-binding protein n=1 Tax=Streptomyces sp. NBC_00442 TaxID=2903651 RepID=UPI002E21E949